MLPGDNMLATGAESGDTNKEYPAQLSKRKKQLENMKENRQAYSNRPHCDWSQTDDDIVMVLRIDNITNEQLRDSDVTFADSDVTIKLADGRNWTWLLHDEIFREDSRVKVRKRRMSLLMKKKRRSYKWSDLEGTDEDLPDFESYLPGTKVPPPSPACSENSIDSQEPVHSPSILSEDSGTQLPRASSAFCRDSKEPVPSPSILSEDSGSHLPTASSAFCIDSQEPVPSPSMLSEDSGTHLPTASSAFCIDCQEPVPSPSILSEDSGTQLPRASSTFCIDSQEPVPSPSILSEDSGTQLPRASSAFCIHSKEPVPSPSILFEDSGTQLPRASSAFCIDSKEPVPSPSILSEDSGTHLPTASSAFCIDSKEPVPSPSILSEDSDTQLPRASSGCIDLWDEQEAITDSQWGEEERETTESQIKEEEPVVQLQLIKHDFIEKDDTFTVHIYVKGVNKDNLCVQFKSNSFGVKFQTNFPAFLKLHKDATEETKFCWRIKLRKEIVTEKCSYKLTASCIELSLAKKALGRWGDLEALKRKETPTLSKSDSWVSVNVNSVSARRDMPTEHERKAMFNVMKQNIERDNLKDKPPDGGLSASPQKPTCKVQPLNKQAEERELVVRPPGFTGLDNLGNTCFMNGVLQCLVNTREFRDFFIDGQFQTDLNTENVLGSGGKLAVSFGVLCKVLWSGKYFSYPPSKLKNLVAQKASQFTGFAQHDSQEFLAFLLDGLHEDLNRVRKKPYTETVEDGGRPDDVVANEAWAIHKRRNNSFIVDLFQGQYKSKLVCPVCGKVSITFDPFLYLSLPLPKRQRLLPVTFMWKDPYRKPVKYMLRLSKEATVEVMKDALQRKTGVNPENIRVFEAYKGRIHKIFSRGTNLSLVQANDFIIACEVLSQEMAGEPVYEVAVVQRTLMPNQFPNRCSSCKKLCAEGSKLKRCTKCFKVGYCDQTCQKNHWQFHRGQCKATPEPVGTPFIISIPESRATFAKVCQLVEAYARYSVDVFQPPVKTDAAPKLSSRLSSSSLSNSSQSSGSQNSLDSQSSFSSSCTITAEQEQNLEDAALAADCDRLPGNSIQSLPVDCESAISSQTGSIGVTDSSVKFQTGAVESNKPTGVGKTEKDKLNVSTKSDSGYSYMSDLHTQLGTSEADKSSTATGTDMSLDKEFTSPVKPVLGIQTGDTTERSTPMFFIKPVNSEGVGLIGVDGERLDDKGDVPLVLSNKFFLSVDWKNNDRLQGYVLAQSKDMDFDNDSSMMTACLEESNVTLEQCLELFTEPEVLSREEAWYCPECKAHREATKQLSTWRLPHTLIIQLKRFSFRNFIWRDKIDKMVEFPTRGLDLSAFYIGSRPSQEPAPIYDLYGIVNHHGGILGGHYTSHVRCADKSLGVSNEVGWRLCDDSRVTAVSHEKNVVTRAAYLLFYRRRQVFVPPPSTELSECVEEDEDEEEYQSASSELDDTADPGEELETKGRLIIDTSPTEEMEVPDLEDTAEDDRRKAIVEIPVITLDDDLGYTDMDSVD